MLDSALAALYGTSTKRLNEQVKRNAERFPGDFMFRLSEREVIELNQSQFATGSQRHRDPRSRPYAFTEHGALMAASVLKSTYATEVSIYVVRAFLKLRESYLAQKDLTHKLHDLERRVEQLAMGQERLSSHARAQFQQVFEALRALMASPEPMDKRPIGFVTEKKEKQA